jgi:hypothetical protein
MTIYKICSDEMIKKYKDVKMNRPASKRGLPEIHATNSIWTGWAAKSSSVTSEIYLFLNSFIVTRYKGRRVIINITRFVI